MAEPSIAEYLYRWGMQFTGEVTFGTVYHRSAKDLKTGQVLTGNELIGAFETLRAAGLAQFRPDLGGRPLEYFVDQAHVTVEFMWPHDWEERAKALSQGE